jgi:hypothetical protein
MVAAAMAAKTANSVKRGTMKTSAHSTSTLKLKLSNKQGTVVLLPNMQTTYHGYRRIATPKRRPTQGPCSAPCSKASSSNCLPLGPSAAPAGILPVFLKLFERIYARLASNGRGRNLPSDKISPLSAISVAIPGRGSGHEFRPPQRCGTVGPDCNRSRSPAAAGR